ncbi:hypothetical protein QQG55_33605 [Brugia pahangi]
MATLAEQLNPTPVQQAENEPSIIEEEIVASTVAGADTEQLSDLSEGYEGSLTSTKGSSSFSFWYHRIAPLVRNRQHSQLLERDMPCFYRFKPWSQCSATCWDDGEPMPVMQREIDENKLVMARGKNFAKCPSNIKEKFIQKAPCNLQRCPLKLSSFSNWTDCLHKNPELRKEGGCYQIRILPLEDRLIYVDTSELTRNCSADKCPEYIP